MKKLFFLIGAIAYVFLHLFAILSPTQVLASGVTIERGNQKPKPYACFGSDGQVSSYGSTCVAGERECEPNPCEASGS